MTSVDLETEIADSIYKIQVNYEREGSFEGRFAGRTLESVQAEYVIRRVREVDGAALNIARAELSAVTADRAALDVAVNGLRELETKFDTARQAASEWIDDSGEHVAQAWELAVADVSALLDKIGGTRE